MQNNNNNNVLGEYAKSQKESSALSESHRDRVVLSLWLKAMKSQRGIPLCEKRTDFESTISIPLG
jgi:hypothetical protein